MNIIGERYGCLTVLEKSENIGRDTAWLVKCDCGNEKVLKTRSFKYGDTKSCGCDIVLRKRREAKYLNKKFGRLLVIREVKSDLPGGTRWLCKCDCGNEKVIRQGHLISTKSCGCLLEQQSDSKRLPNGEAAFRRLYRNYKQQSKERKLSFNLKIDIFRKITSSNCHYCGSSPSNIMKSQNPTVNGIYSYSGIDRIDNSIGYEPNNCVPCCFVCNSMKRAYSYDNFIEHISKIYNNLQGE